MLASNTAPPPEQKLVEVPSVIVAAGSAFTVTAIPVAVVLEQLLAFVTVTV